TKPDSAIALEASEVKDAAKDIIEAYIEGVNAIVTARTGFNLDKENSFASRVNDDSKLIGGLGLNIISTTGGAVGTLSGIVGATKANELKDKLAKCESAVNALPDIR
ncbi:MAG: hypothetical protein LBH41_00095, partial [Rickettsiales bacterium]|nr:hypothetical protein [Rickettsiales bacterium]